MKYGYKDFLPDASAELHPDARASLQDKVAALEKEVGDLKVDFGSLKADFKSLVTRFDFWFKEHLSGLGDDAAKDFAQKFKELIPQAVEATFHSEAQGLYEAVRDAIVTRIHPKALLPHSGRERGSLEYVRDLLRLDKSITPEMILSHPYLLLSTEARTYLEGL